MPHPPLARFLIHAIIAWIFGLSPLIAHATGIGASASPTVIKLVEVASVKKGTLTISWLPTTDDNTPHEQLLYQVYLSEKADFLPDAKTLKAAKTGAVSVVISNLKPGKRHFVLVTATDQDGNVSWSNLMAGHTVAFNAKRTKTAVHTVSVAQMQTAAATGRVALSATKPIAAGDYLVNSEQGGYLRQVISTAKAKNGTVTTDTTSAPLNEIFNDLSFNTTVKFQDLPAQPATSSRMAATAKSSNTDASIHWQDTGLTLSDSEETPAKPTIGKSALVVNGDKQTQTGRFMTLSALAYVSVQPNQAAQWTASIDVPAAKSTETELCKAELLSFTHPDAGKNKLPKPTPTFTRTPDGNGDYRTGSLQMDWSPTDTYVDLEGRPYLAKIKAYVDVKKNACQGGFLGFYKETLEMEIPVYVTQGTPDSTASNKKLIFTGGFTVTDNISYNIKPELNIGATISGGSLRTANLIAKADLSFTNTLTINATGESKLDLRIPMLKEKRFIKVFAAGGIPIVVSGKFKIDAHLQGTAHGKMALKKTLDLKFPNTEFGLQYSKGTWRTIGKTHPAYQLKISGEADANAELTLTLIPDFQVSFYDAASGRLLVEPYLYAQTDLQGQFKYAGIPSPNWDYWFNNLEAGAGANLRLYAGLSIFDYNIASYPAGATIDDIDQFAFSELLTKTPLAKLPTLAATLDESPDIAAPTDSRTMLIQGQATDFVDPFKLSLVKFTAWTTPTVLPAETAKLKSTGQAGGYWFTYTAPGTYTVRLAGYSNLGKHVRQVAEQVIELTDNDRDGMVDQWETRFGVSNPAADDDDDGADNLSEFKAGTYPKDGRFIKIANNGEELPETAVLGNRPNEWACVRDKQTSLVWEVKTNDGGLRDRDWRYTWYDPQYLPDRYFNGYWYAFIDPNHIWAGWENPEKPPYNIYSETNQQLCNAKPTHCNTYAYTNAVNARTLCAANNWRMPTLEELEIISGTIFDYYNDHYDSFGAWFWSSLNGTHSSSANHGEYAWVVPYSGYSNLDPFGFKGLGNAVRLVH